MFSALFALLFIISSSLMADFLDDLYDARWNKIPGLKRLTNVLTASVVSECANGQTGVCPLWGKGSHFELDVASETRSSP